MPGSIVDLNGYHIPQNLALIKKKQKKKHGTVAGGL